MEKETAQTVIHNAPTWLSRFIGREKEKAEIKSLLGQSRLLTLTGPGGCGKTRLALEVAGEMGGEYLDGIWLVELADLMEAERIVQAAAAVFGLVESSVLTAQQQIIAHLKKKRILLVLDNCEHLIDACAQFANSLLSACPDLQIMGTSREPLHIAGETTWLVPSLTLPDMSAGLRPDSAVEKLLQFEAAQLFLERARAVRTDFQIDAHNAQAVLDICQQVDGIPLAIELAAARVNILSVVEMAGQIAGTFHWLENNNRLAPQRQQTLAATVNWSHNLLTQAEQQLFRRLAVFIGGFSLEAAAAVGTESGSNPANVLMLLAHLVDKSFLVRSEINAGESRYRMLEIVRQYGLEKLIQAGEEQAIRGLHLEWCLDFARRSRVEIVQSRRGMWVAQIEMELPNLRQALAWGVSGHSEPALVHQLASKLGQFWQLRGYFREGLGWIEAVLARREGVSSQILAETLDTGGFLAQHLLDLDLAEKYHLEGLSLWKADANQEGVAWATCMIGWIYESRGDYARAQELAEQSMALFETENVVNLHSSGALLLACDLAYLQGDYATAEQYLKKSMDMVQQVGDQLAYTRRQTRLAEIAIDKGSLSRARTLLKQALEANRESEDRWNMAMILVAVVHLNVAQGRLNRAARCLGAVQAHLELFSTNLWPVDRILFEKDLERVKSGLSEALFQSSFAEGHGQGLEVGQAAVFASMMLENPPAQESTQRSGQGARQAKEGLTRRELEIALLIAQGKNNTEIAQTLYLGVRTIEAHVTHILNKLGFSSRTQIAVWAVQQGLQ